MPVVETYVVEDPISNKRYLFIYDARKEFDPKDLEAYAQDHDLSGIQEYLVVNPEKADTFKELYEEYQKRKEMYEHHLSSYTSLKEGIKSSAYFAAIISPLTSWIFGLKLLKGDSRDSNKPTEDLYLPASITGPDYEFGLMSVG